MNPKYHLLIAVAALSLGACSTDDTCTEPEPKPVPENKEHKISFTVEEDAETRTTLEMLEAGNFLRWVSTDKVGIFTGGNNVNSNILTTADVSKSPVEFVGTLEQPVSSGDMFYAYYPYNAEQQSTDPTAVKLSIPVDQQQTKAGVYNGESNPLVAVPMEFQWEQGSDACRISSVRFRQLGAIVEMQLYSSNEVLRSEKIRSVTFESYKSLTGDFSFDLTSVTVKDALPISIYGSNKATTWLEESAVIPATKDETARIYLTIAPGEYSGQIIVRTDVAKYTFRLKNYITFERAVIKGLPADLAKVERTVLSPDDPIHFEDLNVKKICSRWEWDQNGDGDLSYKEAAAITSIGSIFRDTPFPIRSFNELQYFTGLQSIGNSAFYDCSSLTSIHIPEGVTTIEKSAFSGCSSLTNIHLPETVTAIENMAFYGCSSLTNINIPDGVTTIGNSAFDGCSSLTSIHLPDGMTSIGDWTFDGCSGLTSITIPDGVTTIGENAFSGCTSLTNINIPEGVTTIENSAFSHCSSLTSIYLPERITSIGDWSFCYCSSLTSIHLPEGVTSIGGGAFQGCENMTSINIPDGVTSIGAQAFRYCSKLTSSITIPKGVTTIEYGTFQDCSKLTSIHLPDGVTAIEGYAFHGCGSLTSINIPDGVTAISEYTFSGCSSLTSINIPDEVTSIETRAFSGCRGLTSITIPQSVSSIGKDAFYGCSSVSAFYGKYASADHRSLILDGALLAFARGANLTAYTIPDGVTSIGEYAFSWCSSLTSINIPDGVTSIGEYAFNECSSLTSINIPETVSAIGRTAFFLCSNLTNVYCKPATPPSLGSRAFSGTPSTMQIYVPAASVEAYKAAENWSTYASQIVADNN